MKNRDAMQYKIERPKCGCGNTLDPNGYCDGSHLKKTQQLLGFFDIFLANCHNIY